MKFSLLLLGFLVEVLACYAQTSLKQINLETGKFSVGFMHYLTSDSTRTYQRVYDWTNSIIPRPVRISIWYPAQPQGTKKHMRVLEYMQILKMEEEWEYLPDEQLLNWFSYSNSVSNQQHLKEVTTAFKSAMPAKGKFPVVIYAPSYQASSVENFALCELLASHGYIVIASPSRGTDTRFLEGGTLKDLETQARDLDFLAREVSKFPAADPGRMALAGFSFGGMSGVLSQMSNRKFNALVSLDGTVKYNYKVLKASPFFNIQKLDIPFIHFSQKDIPDEVLTAENLDPALNTQFEYYDSLLYSEAYHLKFHHLTHSYFSTMGVLFQDRDKRQDKSDTEIMASYKLVATYTLKFLNAFLKKEPAAYSYLEQTPVRNGTNNDVLSFQSKKPLPKSFSFQDFNELAKKNQYKNLIPLYDSLLSKHPSLQFPEGNFNNLGLQLIFNPASSKEGINIFKLAVHLFPGSANLYDSLGEAYLFI